MATRPIWKHPSDILIRGLDFTRVLPSGATIQGTPTWSVSPAGTLTAAHETVTGLIAYARLQAGTDGLDYVVTGTIVASNSEAYNRSFTVKTRVGI